jgi:hypothetical protein
VQYLFASALLLLLYAVIGCYTYGGGRNEIAQSAPPPTPAAIAQPDLASPSGNGSSDGEPHSADEETQRIMVLQSVLRQRGCYDGPIDGVWSEPTQRAMGDFLHRANAQFPIGVPDATFISLLARNPAYCVQPNSLQAATNNSPLGGVQVSVRPTRKKATKESGSFPQGGADHSAENIFRHPLNPF